MRLDRIRYLGVKASLGFGAALALVLLVNSVTNYRYVAPRVVATATGRHLAEQAALLDRQARTGEPLSKVVGDYFNARRDRVAWVRVLDRDGALAASAGHPRDFAFTLKKIREHLDARQPLSAVEDTDDGLIVTQVFPIRTASGFHYLEIAGYADNSAYWPLRRNLLLNSSAAVALLVALVIIGFGFRSYVRSQRLQEQLELARQVQQGLLPSPGASIEGADFSAGSLAAYEVGGDFYDVFTVGGRPALVLGDVSGKGVPAALLMGVMHGAVRSSRWAESGSSHEELGAHLNRLLYEHSSREKFSTMFWCDIDLTSGSLFYVNAGHCPPLLFHGEEASRLDVGGPVLGLLPYASYRRGVVTMQPGDLLVLYSDGVVEAANAAGEEFGEDRLIELVRRYRHLCADEIRKEVVAAVHAFAGSTTLEDDLTLMLFATPRTPVLSPAADQELAAARA